MCTCNLPANQEKEITLPDYGSKQYFATDPAAGPQQHPRRDGCSWMVLTDVEKNNIKIKAIVFRNTFV